MSEESRYESNSIKEIQLLIFNIMGIRIGVDMEQVFEMIELGQVEGENFEIFHFYEKVPFDVDPYRFHYNSPKVLLVKDEETVTGVVIDQPDDFIRVKIELIQPLPLLLEATIRPRVIWGVTLVEGQIVLLVDLYRLLDCKTIETEKGDIQIASNDDSAGT